MSRLIVMAMAVLLIYGCVQTETDDAQSVQQAESAEERLAEGGYADKEKDYMVPSDYASLESTIGILLNAGNMIGQGHYDELETAADELERNGEDVSELREKLSGLKVASERNEVFQEENPEDNAVERLPAGLLSPRGCEGTGPRRLGASPIALEDLQKILPMGLMSPVHITPTDHQYWHTAGYFGPEDDKTGLDRFNIYAPADGFIVEIETVAGFVDYRVVIEHSCNFYTIFIHIDKLSEKVLSSVKEEDGSAETHAWPRIPVKEGEAIGTIGIGKFDFSVVDEGITLQGFANPESYKGEPWKIHTAGTFDYYDEPLRSMLLGKNVRAAEPFGGRIDYDIGGKLIGSWFRENTNGYRGLGNVNYWESHLSIVYDALDPGHIVVSAGDFGGEARQYGVKGNSPDPKDIGAESGIIKYELVPYDYYAGSGKWDGIGFATNLKARNADEIRGVALFQLIGNGKLKAEFFPGKIGSQVQGFTGNAVNYER